MDEQSRFAGDDRPASPVPNAEAPAPPPQRSSGSSAGSDRALILESDQKTVISKTPPIEAPGSTPVSVNDLGRLLVGQRLGHFVLEQFVGGGGMGAVFRATDTELGRTVAVKVVSGAQNDIETLRRFKNEAQSAARLDHQNIARVYYVGEDQGWHYIVFEFIQGVNVRDLVMQKGPLPLEEALHYTLQVAEALEHAARRDVVHRDIKPSNVLVMQSGTVKVVDMGLARLHQVESPTHDLTASGVTLGTFDYISPEQARDPRNADVRSDLYSLGCTFYYMLTGRPPFPAGTVLQKLLSHSSEPPPDPRDVRPELNEEVTDVLHRLLAKNPVDRFQSPAEFIARLLLLADELGLNLPGRQAELLVTRTLTPITRLEATLPWLVPAAVLVIVVIMIEAFSPAPQLAIGRPILQPPVATKPNNSASATSDTTKPSQSNASALPTSSENRQPSTTKNATEQLTSDTPNSQNQSATSSNPSANASTNANASAKPIESSAADSAVATTSHGDQQPAIAADGGTGTTSDQGNETTSRVEVTSPTSHVAAAEPQAITRIIVAPQAESVPPDAFKVSSIEAAIQKLQELAGVELIELWFNGEMASPPLVITPKDKLRIRAGEISGNAFKPVICFRPDLSSLSSDHRMIDIAGNTEWDRVHFRLELPADPSSNWSMFGLREVQSAQFRNCTFTVRNIDEDVAFFEFLPPQVSKRMEMGMGMDMSDMTQPMTTVAPILRLENCAARGQATFVRAEAAYPFNFSWRQGLLITSERLFSVGGAAEAVQNWDARVEFKLENVTAAMDKGLGLMQLGYKAPHPIGTVVDIKNCVLLTNVDEPFLQHRGLGDISVVRQTGLRYRGDNNFYPARNLPKMGLPDPRILWRLAGTDGETIDITFKDLPKELWYMELPANERVTWKNSENGPSADRQYDRHRKAQYQMDPSPSNLARSAGFDYVVLPDFPDDEVETPSTPPPSPPRTSG